jgi:hypothetical protein
MDAVNKKWAICRDFPIPPSWATKASAARLLPKSRPPTSHPKTRGADLQGVFEAGATGLEPATSGVTVLSSDGLGRS